MNLEIQDSSEELLRFNRRSYLSTKESRGLVGLIFLAIAFSILPIVYWFFEDFRNFASKSSYMYRAIFFNIAASIGILYLCFKAYQLTFFKLNGIYFNKECIHVSIFELENEIISSVRKIFVEKNFKGKVCFPIVGKSGWSVIVETNDGRVIMVKASWVFSNSRKDAEKLCVIMCNLFKNIEKFQS